MKKTSSILDYSHPSLDPAVWDHDLKLYSYHKDFILRLLQTIYTTYNLKQTELWVKDIVIVGSLTTTKWLLTSDLDAHIKVDIEAFKNSNMPESTIQEAFAFLDATRKEFDRAKILAPMTQHPIEYYFECDAIAPSNVEFVGVYSLTQDAWLKEPVMFPADLDFEVSKKDVVAQAELLAESIDASLGKVKRDIKRIDELESVVKAWDRDKQQLFYSKVEQKLLEIEAELIKDVKIRQDLIDARHAGHDAMSDTEIKFKWLARFGFFSILGNIKTLLEETGGKVTTQELPIIDKILSESSLKEAFLKEAFEKETETDICVDLDKTIAKAAKYPEIGEPIEGAKEGLQALKDMGYNVIIYSCRADEGAGVDKVREYLDKHDLPYDSIFEGEKPFAKFYIDDHAIRFDNWDNVLKQVEKSEKKASLYVTAIDAYYHGGSGDSIRQIAKDGYVMAPLETGRANQSPLAGRAYLTKDLSYALIYALGANMVGSSDISHISGGPEGGVVLVAPNEDALIPDEDWLGEQLASGFESMLKQQTPNSIYTNLASMPILNPVFNNLKKHDKRSLWDASYQSMLGKMAIRILQKSYPQYLKGLAKESPHMSHEGNMKVLQAWVFDKARDNPKLQRDGSNFFNVAQEIPVTKTASLKIARLADKYWIDPRGQEYPVENNLGHEGWVQKNMPDAYEGVDNSDQATAMIRDGWTRITTESDYDFAMEVADLNNLPSYLDNFVAQHYTGGGVEIDDLEGNYQDIQDPFPNLRKAIYQAKRLRNAASLFSKKDITAQTKKIKQGNYSCVMALVPHELAQEIVAWGVNNVPDEDVYKDGDKFGRELESHVTIKYGLLTDDGKHVRRSFNNSKPFKAKLGKVRHFQPPELPFDVLTIEVISEDLTKANEMICDKFDCAEGLVSDEYKPHITIAYMKRDTAKEYVGADEFEGKEIELDTVVFSPNKGNRTYFSVGTDKESSFLLEKIDKIADFLPSLFNAPDNKWQEAEGGDDKEIALNPDSVSDDTTSAEPCTTGKPRTKEVWRQFISMFSNLFSKNDTRKIESYDKELEDIEKNELGEDQTLLEYSKDFTDLNLKHMPHNTTWDSLTQDGEPSKPTSVTYSPQISNEDNLDQNSPGGYPRRFMGKPKGEWFSNEGEANHILIDMLKNREAAIDHLTQEITKTAITRQYALYVGGRLAIRTLTRAKAIQTCKERFPAEFAAGNYEIKEEEFKVSSLNKEAGSQSASVPDYLIDEWKTDQLHDDISEEPYVNHDQRDTSYGMHDSPENTGTGIGWPQDNSRAVVHLDTLENPAYRNDPFGIGEYHITYYNAMPMSDGIEQTNED
jgi:hypothetical protein